MMRRGLMGAALALTLAAFGSVSGNAADTRAKAACGCCGTSCSCPACSCDEKANASEACDCCGGAACCSAAKAVKSCCSK